MRALGLVATIGFAVIHANAFGASEITRHVMGAGGLGGTSASYEIRSTLGEPVLGSATSAHHSIRSGFWKAPLLTVAVEDPGDPSIPPPTRFQLLAAPNPMRFSSTVKYAVPAGGGRVVVRVYDIKGALVRTLADHSPEPGLHFAVWDNRDRGGRFVPAGVYFVAMEAPAYRATKRLLVIR